MSGRTLAIGDIHGCSIALAALIGLVSPTADDTVVVLGDVVDRGPQSREAVERLLELQRQCRVVLIMGNHEEMLRDVLTGRGLFGTWLDVGGSATLDSYGGVLDDIPPEHLRFLLSARPYFETDDNIFVHANLESGVALKNQTADWLRWKQLAGSETPWMPGKRVICGHTPQRDGIPWVLDGWVCIDTFAHDGKWLSCLDVETNMVYQASQNGLSRTFPLSQYT